MLGLIKKDIIMIKNNFKTLAIIFIVYFLMAFQGKIDLSFILPFMGVMIMISTFSYDEFNKWNTYLCTLPNGRKNAVRSRYTSTLLMIFVTIFIVTISSLIMYNKTQSFNYEEVLSTMLGVSFTTILFVSFMYPIIYKFGVEKARIGIFTGIFGIAIIISLLSKIYDFSKLIKLLDVLENYIMIIMPIIMIGMLYTSYKISIKINLKKEF